jgi:glycosyltransferase involved in cell wall biosynthesis
MPPIVSFLIPTRKRPHGCQKALDSILKTATNIDNVEVCFLVDDDDVDTIEWVANTEIQYPNLVHGYVTPRIGNGYEHIYMYYNQLAGMANGDFLFIFNDDTVMVSAGWDEVLERHRGECILLDPKWTYTADFSTFPILSRKFYDRMVQLCW